MPENEIDAKAPQTVKAKAAIPVEQFPNKRKYSDGYVFNFPISHYESRAEAKIKQDLLDGGNSVEQTELDMNLIREALAFHQTGFKG